MDVVLNFFTGIVTSSGAVEDDRGIIAKHYLLHWFIIDVVSALPYELVIILTTDQSDTVAFRAPLLLCVGVGVGAVPCNLAWFGCRSRVLSG